MIDCEIYLAMNEDGDWIVTSDPDAALSDLAEHVGGTQARLVKVTIKMAPPVWTETTVVISEHAGELHAIAE